MRVELILMTAGDRWHDYMQVEHSAHAPKCVLCRGLDVCPQYVAEKSLHGI